MQRNAFRLLHLHRPERPAEDFPTALLLFWFLPAILRRVRPLDTQVGSPCAELVSEIRVSVGYAVEEILDAADDKNCDVILLGSRCEGVLRHTCMGSMAAAAPERSRSPVFIIPLPTAKTDEECGAGSGRPAFRHSETGYHDPVEEST